MPIRNWLSPFHALTLCALVGCSSLTGKNEAQSIAHFDLGPSPTLPALARPWNFDLHASGDLETPAMRYRLAYANPTQVRVYAASRWVALPSEILRRYLEPRLYWPNGAPHDRCFLDLELLRFEQVFQSTEESKSTLMIRAALQRNSQLIDERLLLLEYPAKTADAPGGVAAMAQTAKQLAQALKDWRGESGKTHPACKE